MSGIISEAELLAVTLIFAAALVATGINLFLVLNMSTRHYLDRYVDAVVSHTDCSVEALTARGVVSFPDIAEAIRSDSMNINKVTLIMEETSFSNMDANKAYHILFKFSHKLGRINYTMSGTDYTLTIIEEMD